MSQLNGEGEKSSERLAGAGGRPQAPYSLHWNTAGFLSKTPDRGTRSRDFIIIVMMMMMRMMIHCSPTGDPEGVMRPTIHFKLMFNSSLRHLNILEEKPAVPFKIALLVAPQR